MAACLFPHGIQNSHSTRWTGWRSGSAIVSLSSPSTHFLPVREKPGLCRKINLAGHALTVAHPDRFSFFASLPLPDVDAALREIAHAFDTLEVDGVILETNINGAYLARLGLRLYSANSTGARPSCFSIRPAPPASTCCRHSAQRRCWNSHSIRRGRSWTYPTIAPSS